MITINLLPEELRFKEVKQLHIPYKKIAVGLFLIVFVFFLFSLFTYVRVRGEYGMLQKKWKQLADKNIQAEALENELGSSITSEVDFYDHFVDPPLETAQVMNLISDLIPSNVWLNQLVFSRRKKDIELVLNGASRSLGKTSKLIDIQNFANSLKLEMEKFLGSRLKMAVTTSSRTNESEMDITEFSAHFTPEESERK